MFASNRSYTDQKLAQPDKNAQKKVEWIYIIDVMKNYYKPIENPTLRIYYFRALTQSPEETFSAYSNRVQKESKCCKFKCHNEDCIADWSSR